MNRSLCENTLVEREFGRFNFFYVAVDLSSSHSLLRVYPPLGVVTAVITRLSLREIDVNS